MNMVYEKILVAIDGSEEAEWAFKKAINIAKRNSAQLILCNIIDSREVTVSTYGLYADSTFIEHAEKAAKELLETYQQTAKEQGIEQVKAIIKFGSPKTKISKEVAPYCQADLIVCGATGMNAVERILVGSVSENILRYASCDVLVVRTPKEE
ncbi:nucleotide-binding universal stress UspA family protein [Metabacillus crassostreae]|uniref:universal stress protein n=1 Tax=Metabacillus crassostreae TaxID=929098 RepID=UPI001956FBE2|nr:universal stress protein [Metabacillus crassostreae]MBM7602957.1 nucleotide-binding universal stress UspA family protein [Metabacillus crassostreae]